jgi:hypothetical protein
LPPISPYFCRSSWLFAGGLQLVEKKEKKGEKKGDNQEKPAL